MTPRQVRTVHCELLNDEVCLYDWSTKEVHALNCTAARIWQFCDGHTSVQQIAERLAPEFGIRDAEAVVWMALADFQKKGLVEGTGIVPPHRTVSRRQLIARLGLAAAALPIVSSIIAPTPLQAASAGSQTFAFTGAPQMFIVPVGVTLLTIDAFGAQGGSGSGGKGGRVQATFTVTPGETLTVLVGGAGTIAGPDAGGPSAGGFNGGGTGAALFGAGGGGASDVRRSSARLIVAGGGGGSAPALAGGDGGGLIGAAGPSETGANSGQGGGGGTQSAGGTGGSSVNNSGMAGSSGLGGDGGSGPAGGGGGGGGFFGGGGGGSSGFQSSLRAGSGGGGSSFTDPSAIAITHAQGVRMGDGVVVFNW